MNLISLTSFNGQLGHIKRGQEFKADPDYGKQLIEKKMAVEAPQNKSLGDSPKNKSAGSNASSSPAGQASLKKTRTTQKKSAE